jgi:hypothetical protein
MKEKPVGNLILGRYTRQGLWNLFLMCALPLHIWTLILAFRDLSWLTDRTNAWDAVGVLCYGLLFALVESILLFVVTALLGLLVPPRWDIKRRIGLLSVLVLLLSVWSMLEQLYFLAEVRLPGSFIGALVRSQHPFIVLNAVILALLIATFLAPAIALVRSERAVGIVNGLIDRLSLLATLYLLFDVVAVVVVVIRNV